VKNEESKKHCYVFAIQGFDFAIAMKNSGAIEILIFESVRTCLGISNL